MNETIVLELVGDTTVFDIDWLSVYDLQSKDNYGWVLIPDEPNVPPSLKKIVVSIILQSKYQCKIKKNKLSMIFPLLL